MIIELKKEQAQKLGLKENQRIQLIEQAENEIVDSLATLFKSKAKISDDDVHELAEKLKISPHKLEEFIYEFFTAFFNGGLSSEKKFKPDANELKIGMEVEKEHINNDSVWTPIIAEKIAMDHLAELED